MDSDAMIEVAEREILPELANMKLCAKSAENFKRMHKKG
jgi:hypothetical protein